MMPDIALTHDTLQKLAASGGNARIEYQGEMLLSAISKISNWQLVMTVPDDRANAWC